MSVAIRLSKIGKKNAHSFRVVVMPKRSKRDGDNLEVLGFFDPSHNPAKFEIDKTKLDEWVKNGAQVSPAVSELLAGNYKFKKYDPKAEKEAAKEQA